MVPATKEDGSRARRDSGGLTVKEVQRLLTAGARGRHLDGDGLYLEIDGPNAAHWSRRYQFGGRERWVGLGSARTLGLVDAREKNRKVSYQLAEGIDPIAHKRAETAGRKIVAVPATGTTFGQAAEEYYRLNAQGWDSDKHRAQWSACVLGRSLTGKPSRKGDYCKDLRALPLTAIDPRAVVRLLEPIWLTKSATAKRVRQRIEAVFNCAIALEWMPPRANPADFAILQHILAKVASSDDENHHPAVPYQEIPAVMRLLQRIEGSAARALEFLILTAARSTETTQATWPEMHLSERTWIVGKERMKGRRGARKPHRVPLSSAAIDVLNRVWTEDGNSFVFIGSKRGKGIGDNTALLKLLQDGLGRTETVHGLRTSFKEWATANGYDDVWSEKALAHKVGTKVRRAYQRDDLLELRRPMMEAWGQYCTSPPFAAADNVVQIATAAR